MNDLTSFWRSQAEYYERKHEQALTKIYAACWAVGEARSHLDPAARCTSAERLLLLTETIDRLQAALGLPPELTINEPTNDDSTNAASCADAKDGDRL